jgi:5-methylcytosine-specific restriction endonuclease McrA
MSNIIPKELRTHLRSAARKIWMYYDPARKAVREESHLSRGRYLCSACGEVKSKIEIDHLTNAGSFTTYEEFTRFLERLFCNKDGLAALCPECHLTKTNAQRANKKT